MSKWSSFKEQQLLTESFRKWISEGEEAKSKWDEFTSDKNLKALSNMTDEMREKIIINYLDQILGDGEVSDDVVDDAVEDVEDSIEDYEDGVEGEEGDEGDNSQDVDLDDIEFDKGDIFVSNGKLVRIVEPSSDQAGKNSKVSPVDPDTCETQPRIYAVTHASLKKSDSECPDIEDETTSSEDGEYELRTTLGKQLASAITQIERPREYIDFLKLMRKIITNPSFIENAKTLGRRADYDQGDLVAMNRLIKAFQTEEARGGEE